MAEEFNLEQVVSNQQQAQADRDFYLSFVQRNSTMSPIASYLAGAAGAKYASMSGKLYAEKTQYERDRQAKEDADKAAEKAMKRRDDLQNQVLNIFDSVSKGEMPMSAAAVVLGPLFKESGIGNLKQIDTANNTVAYTDENGEDKVVDFKEIVDFNRRQKEAGLAYKQAQAESTVARAELAGAQKNLQEEKAKTEKEIRRGKVAKLPLEIRKLEAQGVLTEEKAFTEAAKRAIMMTPEEARAKYATDNDYKQAMAEAAKYNSQAAKARAEKALQSGNDNKFSDFYRVNKNLIEIARKENFLADIQNENDVPDNALVDFLNGYRKGYDLEGTLAIVLDEARRRGIDVSGFKIEEEEKEGSSEKQKVQNVGRFKLTEVQ